MSSRKPINKHLRVQVLLRDHSKCRICGRSQEETPLEVDHIIPVSEGGTDELSNLAALCCDCNRGKSDYHFSDYNSILLLPDGIESHFKYYKDDKRGDYEKYHLYCYYSYGSGPNKMDDKFHREWKLTRNDFLESSDPKNLEEKQLEKEKVLFVEDIRKALAVERKRIIQTENGLIKV
jgi:hypothetical protein